MNSVKRKRSIATIQNSICVICKIMTNEKVFGLCVCNCSYFCHDKCLINWITVKQNDAFCVICTIPYAIELIELAIFRASRLNHVYIKKPTISLSHPVEQTLTQTLSQKVLLPINFNNWNTLINIQTDNPSQIHPQKHTL
jgi:hypothetical protein